MPHPLTHHIQWDRPGHPRDLMKAICGAIIERRASSGKPTCPECQQILHEWELADQEIADALTNYHYP